MAAQDPKIFKTAVCIPGTQCSPVFWSNLGGGEKNGFDRQIVHQYFVKCKAWKYGMIQYWNYKKAIYGNTQIPSDLYNRISVTGVKRRQEESLLNRIWTPLIGYWSQFGEMASSAFKTIIPTLCSNIRNIGNIFVQTTYSFLYLTTYCLVKGGQPCQHQI